MPETVEDQAREALNALAEHTNDLLRQMDDDEEGRAVAAPIAFMFGTAAAAVTYGLLAVAHAVDRVGGLIEDGRCR